MNKNIVFYGGRGVINSIILDIEGDLYKEKKFLDSIVLHDENKLTWVDDVISMKYFAEPCFSEFGNPDLIIKATTNKNENYVLFIEAKLGSYIDSALELINSTDGYFPKTYKNNSSKINIQLAYRYRFVMASKACNNESIIEEMDDVNSIYKDETKRKLKHRRVIDFWNKNLKDAKKYYFIAMTNDSIEVIENEFPYDNNKIIPPIGNANWKKDKNCFGITTYEMLEQSQIINRNSGYYCDSSSLMLFTPSSSSKDKDGEEHKELKSINIEKSSDDQKKLGEYLKEWIERVNEIKFAKKSLIVMGISFIVGLILIFSSASIGETLGINAIQANGGSMDTSVYENIVTSNTKNFRVGGMVISLVGGFGSLLSGYALYNEIEKDK